MRKSSVRSAAWSESEPLPFPSAPWHLTQFEAKRVLPLATTAALGFKGLFSSVPPGGTRKPGYCADRLTTSPTHSASRTATPLATDERHVKLERRSVER